MTALDVLQNVLSLMDETPYQSLSSVVQAVIEMHGSSGSRTAAWPSFDKAVELLMAYADPFDDDTPTHRLYGRLYRWCQSVNLNTQRDAVVWAIGVLDAIQPLPANVTKVTIHGKEYDTEDIEQWCERR